MQARSFARTAPAPGLVIKIDCGMDCERDHEIRCADDTDRGAQRPHIRRGGAAHEHQLMNSNSNLNSTRTNRRILMRASDAFPSKYVKAADVKAKSIVAVISHLAQEKIGQGQDQQEKHVLHFENAKPLVLNRTNWESLEDAFGDSDGWSGHKIKLYAARTQYQGKMVDAVRVQPIAPKPAPKAAEDDPNDDAPLF
jgi:hypothetical protein